MNLAEGHVGSQLDAAQELARRVPASTGSIDRERQLPVARN